jgi:hypothetical protein
VNRVEYIINHKGPWVSWNTLLSLSRWQRSKLLVEAKQQYREMLAQAKVEPLSSFQIDVRYWSRIDCDNICLKYFIDTMRHLGLVVNDDKRFFAGISSSPDNTLVHNTYRITISGIKANPEEYKAILGYHDKDNIAGDISQVISDKKLNKKEIISTRKARKVNEIEDKKRSL